MSLQSNPEVENIANRWRGVLESKGEPGKVMSLDAAIERHVRPKDTLYFGGSMARPNAAMFQVARQFWGSDPKFTVATPAFANHHVVLVQGGLIIKAITTIHASTFPVASPNRTYGEAFKSGAVEFENWSLLTFSQRLQAGAMGLPFASTKSLVGSDLGAELAASGNFATVPDPFGGDDIGVVRAFHPDVTFIHGLAADEQGNTLISPPLYDNVWAAFAAKRAVIVTVERIVPSEFIRRHCHLGQLPGSAVTAVCEVPMGGHPAAVPGDSIPEIGGYTDDYEFLDELQTASASSETLDQWIADWITGCATHWDYLAKLGDRRISYLRGKTKSDGWRFEYPRLSAKRKGLPVSEAEDQVVLAARTIRRRVEISGKKALLAGLGTSALAAWMAAFLMREDGERVELMVEAGTYGYIPMPMDPFLFNYRNMFTAKSLGDLNSTLGVMTGGFDNQVLGVLGAAQVDKDGNLNSSRVPGRLLTGSGGANDIASGASEVLVTTPHSDKRLVDKVDFITSPGRVVRTIVTNRAVIERDDSGQFMLSAVLSQSNTGKMDLIAEALKTCGWDLSVGTNVEEIAPPTEAEIELLRLFDPEGYFIS